MDDLGSSMIDQYRDDIAWRDFLRSYAAGHSSALAGENGRWDTPPAGVRLPSLKHVRPDYHGELDTPLYKTSSEIDIVTARKVREFYEEKGYLAPPRSPSEALRMRCVQDYELTRPSQLANIQTATNLVSLHFPSAICTFSLYLDDAQHHMAAAGPPQGIKDLALDVGTRVPPHISLCGHAILQRKGLHFISDLANDWRFRGNPWVRGGTRSYIGIGVNLATNPGKLLTASETPEQTVSIGTLNVLFFEDRLQEVSPAQLKFLEQITHILEEQMRSTWLGRRHMKDFKAKEIVLDYLESSLVNRAFKREVHSSLSDSWDGGKSVALPATLKIEIPVEAQYAVDSMQYMLRAAELVCIVDVSVLGIHETEDAPELGDMTELVNDVQILGSYCSAEQFDMANITSLDGITALHSFLRHFPQDSRTTFELDRDVSGLEALLPNGTSAHIAMPFFSGDIAMFIVLVSTRDEGRYFDQIDSASVRSMATVFKALAIQSRAVEAEHKKTRVMSRFSHAMRTPIHGMLSSIGMLKEAFDRKDMEQVADSLTYLDATSMDLEKLTNAILDQESSVGLDQGRRSGKPDDHAASTSPYNDWVKAPRKSSLLPLTPSLEQEMEFPFSPVVHHPEGEHLRQTLDQSLRITDAIQESVPLKVLIVEDNEISRKLLAMAVKRSDKDIELTQACDGVEGLSAFCKVHPDLVFTDVNMPFMDGVASAKAMRGVEVAQRWTRCRIYTVTGLGRADSRLKRDALSATIDGWLVKGQHRLEEIQGIVRDLQHTINGQQQE